ncbi:MAG: cytochrome c oxidase assembly factor Coa1 family protein [Elusimicrobiales bacterium]
MKSISKNIRIVLITLALLIPLGILVHQSVVMSDEYKLAVGYIHNNPLVNSELGEIRDCSLSLHKHSSIIKSSIDGNANLFIKTIGTQKTAIVHVHLTKAGSVWRVEDAYLLRPDGNFLVLPVNIRVVDMPRR